MNQITSLQNKILNLKSIEDSIKQKYAFHESRELSKAELIKATTLLLLDFKNDISEYKKTSDSLSNTLRNGINQNDYDYLSNSNTRNLMNAFNFKYASTTKLYRQKILGFLPKYDSSKYKNVKLWELPPESPFWNEEYDHTVNPLGVEDVYNNLDYLYEELKSRKN